MEFLYIQVNSKSFKKSAEKYRHPSRSLMPKAYPTPQGFSVYAHIGKKWKIIEKIGLKIQWVMFPWEC